MKNILSYLLVSLTVSATMLGIYHYSGWGTQIVTVSPEPEASAFTFDTNPVQATYTNNAMTTAPADFHLAADAAMPAVVHITAKQTNTAYISDPFYELFGWAPQQGGSRQSVSTGSGVILSGDGYIVTNNHVIKSADELTVTLYDNRTFKAKVIGTDPSTDLGLIKIEGEHFPAVKLANSDEIRVGEWVLAVGNPFNLASTATAGIVSAIGRDLQIIKDQMAIESFIQTDAAVNPGNSGGALVNLNGELIGVNTAIASPTGTYAGYAFAVPANIVRKVVSDLKEFGNVQRGFLGVSSIESINGDLAKTKHIDITEGVLVEGLIETGGAYQAGIREGDVIVSINNVPVKNDAKLREMIARNRPGEQIEVKVYRDSRYQNFPVVLTNAYGETEITAVKRTERLTDLGIEFRDLSEKELNALQIDKGVLVNRLHAGKVRQQTNMKENFIVIRVNDRELNSADDFFRVLKKESGQIKVTGFYPRSNRLVSYMVEL